MNKNSLTYAKIAKYSGVFGLLLLAFYWPIGCFLVLLAAIFYKLSIVNERLSIYKFVLKEKYILEIKMDANDSEGSGVSENPVYHQYVLIPDKVFKCDWPDKQFLPDKLKHVVVRSDLFNSIQINDSLEVLLGSQKNFYAYQFKGKFQLVKLYLKQNGITKSINTFIDQNISQYAMRLK